MSECVQYAIEGRVAVLAFQNGRVNSLSFVLRQALHENLLRALSDAQCDAIVLMGQGRGFSAGADIREVGTTALTTAPTLPDLIQCIARSPKPVVAAVSGVAYGGGLELALSAAARIADRSARLALPEVKLGLIPGAGGTQRLPRLIGLAAAARLIVFGESVDAVRAHALGLVADVAAQDLRAEAVRLAEGLVPTFMPSVGDTPALVAADDSVAALEALAQQLQKKRRGYRAPFVALDCVRAASRLPLSEGLVYERKQFESLVGQTEARALQHLFFAERQADRGLAVAEPLPPIARVCVVGGGLMGSGICIALADAGLQVSLVEQAPDALERAKDRLEAHYQKEVTRGRLDTTGKAQRLSRIRPVLGLQNARDADLVIEAVFEDMGVKQAIFSQLDGICPPATIFATNTSRLDVNQLAGCTQRPDRFLGLHFFSPANIMRLLEVVRGVRTAPEVLARAFELAGRLRKIPVLVGVCEGFVGNRMLTAYRREANFLLEEGASVVEVDTALRDFGMAMGPFAMTDMAGLDISWAARKRLAATRDPARRYSVVADRLCEMGRFGQKTGAGYYRYETGSRTPIPDPVVEQLIADCAREAGIARRAWTPAEIVERTMCALINEGIHILSEGIARQASDVDLVYVHGYGFPAWRGGPMFYADTMGLDHVYARVVAWQARFGPYWTPSPLFERLVKSDQPLARYCNP